MVTKKTTAAEAAEEKRAAEAAGAPQEDKNGAAGETAQPNAGAPQAGTQEPEKREPWSGYNQFVYIGPTLPGGMLNSNAIFKGTFGEIKTFLAPVLVKYPQAERLIFPVEKLGEQLFKVKTPGNIANKYFNDLVSLSRANKEE